MAGRNAFVKQFKQFNGSPPAHTRGRPDDRERSVKLFAEVQQIYRECSPAAAKEMCRLAVEAEDERVRSVCLGMKAPPFDPKLYTLEELKRMRDVMLMIAERQGMRPPEEGEDVAG